MCIKMKTVFVPKVEPGERADVQKVELGEQRKNYREKPNPMDLRFIYGVLPIMEYANPCMTFHTCPNTREHHKIHRI